MILANNFNEYKILDTGDGQKLESWNGIIVSRPDPQVIWKKQEPELWSLSKADYIRSKEGGGSWDIKQKLPEKWIITRGALKFYVRPTGFKHMGLFPEQSANWDFCADKISNAHKKINVLNLFAYTGGATIACAAAGADVVHVDAAKSMNSWAKDNLALSGLGDRKVRFLADDAIKFIQREIRRGHKYDGIIMDPPSYGRSDNAVFKAEKNIFELVESAAQLLSDDPLFFILNSYTTGFSGVVSENILKLCIKHTGNFESSDLCLPIENQTAVLPCGTTARWYK